VRYRADGPPICDPGRKEHSLQIVVNYDLCESNALCMQAAPELFEVREDDLLYVLNEFPDENFREKAESAVRACPKQAIEIAD
jgi:ferredoxin